MKGIIGGRGMNSLSSYYCQHCRAIHEQLQTNDQVFKTGFIFVSSVKYPLGVCRLGAKNNGQLQ